jgi:site-specific DNA-cytosine methylase
MAHPHAKAASKPHARAAPKHTIDDAGSVVDALVAGPNHQSHVVMQAERKAAKSRTRLLAAEKRIAADTRAYKSTTASLASFKKARELEASQAKHEEKAIGHDEPELDSMEQKEAVASSVTEQRAHTAHEASKEADHLKLAEALTRKEIAHYKELVKHYQAEADKKSHEALEVTSAAQKAKQLAIQKGYQEMKLSELDRDGLRAHAAVLKRAVHESSQRATLQMKEAERLAVQADAMMRDSQKD